MAARMGHIRVSVLIMIAHHLMEKHREAMRPIISAAEISGYLHHRT